MAQEFKPVQMLPLCYGCGNKSEEGTELLSCGRCRANKYCSKDCMKNHWLSRHKQTCPILSIALVNPHSKICQFWKTALKYEPMTDQKELLENRTPELLSRLPLYGVVEDKENILHIGPLGGCPEGLEFITGFILQSLGLSEELDLAGAEGYIENVAVYESGYLIGYSRVNEKVIELLSGAEGLAELKEHKKMDHSVWKITGGYVPPAVPANLPLHTPLTDHPLTSSEATQTLSPPAATMTKEALVARLPGYEFKNNSCKLHKKYLTLINHSEDETEMNLNAHLLLSYQLLKPETEATSFISGVKVYDESTSQDVCVSNVHQKSIELLCGQEGVTQLKNCKNLSLESWLLTGGGSEENGFQPVLHQIVKK